MKYDLYLVINEDGSYSYYKNQEFTIPYADPGGVENVAIGKIASPVYRRFDLKNGIQNYYSDKDYKNLVRQDDFDKSVKTWFNADGKYHRENGPARIWDSVKWNKPNDISKEWMINSRYHRLDGPAIERFNGEGEYYINGKRLSKEEFHAQQLPKKDIPSKNTLLFYKRKDSAVFSFQDAECSILHRDNNLPAIECDNGDKIYYQNGKRHREDGPAVECANGDKFWYWHGKKCTESEFELIQKREKLHKEVIKKNNQEQHDQINKNLMEVVSDQINKDLLELPKRVEPLNTHQDKPSAKDTNNNNQSTKIISKGEKEIMSKFDETKNDVVEGLKRVPGRKAAKWTRNLLLTFVLKQALASGKTKKEAKIVLQVISDLLDSPGGLAAIHIVMGLGLRHTPLDLIQNSEFLQGSASEFIREGTALGGEEISDFAMGTLAPGLMSILNGSNKMRIDTSLDALIQNTKVDVVETIIEEEEEEIPKKVKKPSARA